MWRKKEKEKGSWFVCARLCMSNNDKGREGNERLHYCREQATTKYINPAFLCLLTGLWIQMSPPLDSAPVGDQQCVTDRRVEPVAALNCVASNWPWLSSAWTNE